MDQLTAIGRIRDAHGLKGEVFLALKAKQADWLDDVTELVFATPAGESKTFLIESVRPHKDGLLVFLEGVTDRTQAEALRGSIVSVAAESLQAEPGERLYLGELLGRKIEDATLGVLGPVVALGSNGAQDLLVVETSKGRFEIPLVDDFLKEITPEIIHMDLPEGLLEI